MFGLCIAGRLPQTPSSQPDETHLVFTLQDAQSINHVTVFMDGTTPFPAGYAATVHFLLPGGDWKLLGCLKNDKPSAIFRLRGTLINSAQTGSGGSGSAVFRGGGDSSEGASSSTALLGISVETEQSVDGQMANLKAAGGGSNAPDSVDASAGALVKHGSTPARTPIDPQVALALAPKIGEHTRMGSAYILRCLTDAHSRTHPANNIFSYLSSFAPDSAPQTVPLLQKWLEQFERKLKMQGSEFLERQG